MVNILANLKTGNPSYISLYSTHSVNVYISMLSYHACILSYRAFILTYRVCILSGFPFLSYRENRLSGFAFMVYQVLRSTLSCIRFCVYQVLRISCQSKYLGIFMNKTQRSPTIFYHCRVINVMFLGVGLKCSQ